MNDAATEVSLSESAARRIAHLREKKGPEGINMMLRLTVSGGGCSGFQYEFSFDTKHAEDDHLFSRDGVTLVVDDASLPLVMGAEVDYEESLTGSFFKVNNPNAASSCGCGTSFSIG